MALTLSNQTLAALGKGVRVPGYERHQLQPGILHIGLGNFHRSHMATYLERLFNQGNAHEWAVIGAGVMLADARMRRRLKAQDWLSTVVDLEPAGSSARVVGAMVDFVPVAASAIIKALLDPGIRIVSLTITEGGYFLDAASGRFDACHPRILADIAAPQTPRTLFGMLVRALAERRARGLGPFTVLSCDNLLGNGAVTRSVVLGLAERIDPELAAWIRREVSFPNSMVDCITPRTGERERALVRQRFGISDAAPVVCEPFRQWVVEDCFCAGRPPLEKVGVEFVGDVASHETMKLRLLNASHASLAYVAALLGYQQVHAAVSDPDIRDWLLALQDREILPTLSPAAGLDYREYRARIMRRLCNPEMGDTVSRLCASGSARQPKFILPALRDAMDKRLPVMGLALELALWCQYCRVADDTLGVPGLADAMAARLKRAARDAGAAPLAFLGIKEVFAHLGESPELQAAFAGWLALIERCGPRAAICRYRDYGNHGLASG